MKETIEITTSDGEMGAVVSRPDGKGPFPVIVLLHHGPGLDEGTHQEIDAFSSEGYYVISHDRYHRHGRFLARKREELLAAGPEEVERFMKIFVGTTDDLVARDIEAVLTHLEGDPAARGAPMGCVGYCIGARGVLRALEAHPGLFSVAILLHPTQCVTEDDDSPHKVLDTFGGYIYVGIGSADEIGTVESNRALIDAVNARGERGMAEIHEGAEHGFAVRGMAYHEGAAARSHQQASAMFKTALA